MSEPPVCTGAIKLTVTNSADLVVIILVGGSGTTAAITLSVLDQALLPMPLIARTLKTYDVPVTKLYRM